MDTDLINTNATANSLLGIHIPLFEAVNIVDPPIDMTKEGDHDWNLIYQQIVDRVVGTVSKDDPAFPNAEEEEKEHSEEVEDFSIQGTPPLPTDLHEKVGIAANLDLAAFRGEFIKIAIEGKYI